MTLQGTTLVSETYGRKRVTVAGQDVTFFRRVPLELKNWSRSEPFGWDTCGFYLRAATLWETWGSGDLAWLYEGADVTVEHVNPDGTLRSGLPDFDGEISTIRPVQTEDSYGFDVTCIGILKTADNWVHTPPVYLPDDEHDIGTRIPHVLDHHQQRKYAAIPYVTTGITTRKLGSLEQSPLGFAAELLADATTDDGTSQWTLMPTGYRQFGMMLKDTSTRHYTISLGQPGLDTSDLEDDLADHTTCIYAEWTTPDGCRCRNTKYPNLHPDTTPLYPLPAGQVFDPGSAFTGFAPFADEMRDDGYPMDSGDTYLASDEDSVRRAQEDAGILVDGIVGPQTWAAVMNPGQNQGSLTGSYIAPVAIDKRVDKHLYNAAGAVIGDNPDYDPAVPRIEAFYSLGENLTKRDVTRTARALLARDKNGGLFGQIVLTTDPEECSRFDMQPNRNMWIKHLKGGGKLLHIAGVTVDWQAQSVTLMVDERHRDYLTLAAIKQRKRDAATDPARQALNARRRSRTSTDTKIVWDCENGAGRIPLFAIYGGLWSVIQIPGGSYGTIARSVFAAATDLARDQLWRTTPDGRTVPRSDALANPVKFAVGVFGREVTSNQVDDIIGNPFDTDKKWDREASALADAGLLIAWGGQWSGVEQAAGYWPGAGADGDPLTGRMVDDSSWDFGSAQPPWLWVAVYSPSSCRVQGELQIAPEA